VSSDSSNLPVTTLSTLLKTTTYDPYLTSLLEKAERTFRASRAKSTRRAYEHDWKMFRAWCEDHGFVPLPASSQAVILYATELTKNQERRLGTLCRRLAVISQAHERMHFDSPTKSWEMKKFMAGLRRELGVAPEQKKPISVPDLKKIVAQTPATLIRRRKSPSRSFCWLGLVFWRKACCGSLSLTLASIPTIWCSPQSSELTPQAPTLSSALPFIEKYSNGYETCRALRRPR